MSIKPKDLQKRTVVEVQTLDLYDLYTMRVAEGKKRASQHPMTVAEFITLLMQYNPDAVVQYERGYYGEDGCFSITHTREETDAEYAERIAILEKLEADKAKKAKADKSLRKERDVATMKALAKRLNLKNIQKELENL